METTISFVVHKSIPELCNTLESSLQVDKNLSFLDSYVKQSLEQGAQPYIPENERSGMINVGNFRSQDQHDTSTHALRFEAYDLPKTSAPPRISPASLSSSTELVPVPEPSYPVERHHVASMPSASDIGSTELKLRLDGVQKKWGRPTYSSPALSSLDSTSHKAVNGVTQSDVSSTSTSRTRDNSSYDSRSAQTEISSEKKKLAASLFGGASKTEKRPSSTSHKVGRSASSPAVEKSQGPKAVASSSSSSSSSTGVASEKAAPLQPPPDLLDLGEPTVTSNAPSVDPFKQLEGLIDPNPATPATKAADIMSIYSEFPTSGQSSSVIVNPLPANAGDANLIPGLSPTNKTGQPKGPNPRDALEKDALVRQMGVTPMSQNPNLFRDLLG